MKSKVKFISPVCVHFLTSFWILLWLFISSRSPGGSSNFQQHGLYLNPLTLKGDAVMI